VQHLLQFLVMKTALPYFRRNRNLPQPIAWRSCHRKTMMQTSALYTALLGRRSANARFLAAPAPDAQALARMATAFSRAPDHGRLVPFRLIEIAQEARPRLADLVEAATLVLTPDLPVAERERAREKATQGPMILALVARIQPEHLKISASDQWLAVGAALENFLLAAQEEGFGVAIRSGRYLEQAPLQEGLGLGIHEHLVSLLALGTVSEYPPEKPKPALDAVFSRWVG
jgi:nitroreductase